MKKKVIFCTTALFFLILVSLFVRNEIIFLDMNSILLKDFTKKVFAESESGGSYYCSSGGPGSTSCSVSFSGGASSIKGGTSCSVTCTSGYYACCNAYYNRCQCIKY